MVVRSGGDAPTSKVIAGGSGCDGGEGDGARFGAVHEVTLVVGGRSGDFVGVSRGYNIIEPEGDGVARDGVVAGVSGEVLGGAIPRVGSVARRGGPAEE